MCGRLRVCFSLEECFNEANGEKFSSSICATSCARCPGVRVLARVAASHGEHQCITNARVFSLFSLVINIPRICSALRESSRSATLSASRATGREGVSFISIHFHRKSRNILGRSQGKSLSLEFYDCLPESDTNELKGLYRKARQQPAFKKRCNELLVPGETHTHTQQTPFLTHVVVK